MTDNEARRVEAVATLLRADKMWFGRPQTKGGILAPAMWHVDLGYLEAWGGAHTWELCFGKDSRCLVDPDDPRTTACAEIIVARRLLAGRFDAGWLNTYRHAGPSHWTPRMDPAVVRQRIAPKFPTLAERVGSKGTPDVFGSDGADFIFLEVKRSPDKLDRDQIAWVDEALAAGLRSSQVLIATWNGSA